MWFEHQGMVAADVAGDHVEVDRSGAGGAVVAALIVDVVEVKADETGGAGGEVAFVIEKVAEVLDAGMPRVVPITDRCLFAEVGEELVEAVVEWQFEDALAVLHAEDEIVRDDGRKNLVVGRENSSDRTNGPLAKAGESLFPDRGIGRRLGFENDRWIAKEKRGAAGVHHDIPGSDTGGELEGALGVEKPEGSFVFLAGGWLEEIRGGVTDRGRQRTEIVDGGNGDDPLVDGAEDPRSEVEADAVAEFTRLHCIEVPT